MAGALRSAVPGLVLLAVVAATAHAVAVVVDVTPLILAVVLGALAANALDLPDRLDAGIAKHDFLLETAIVLLGASVPLDAILESGSTVVVLAVATVAFGVAFVEVLARWGFRVGRDAGSLLAAGASICGVSAIVAVGRGIDADRETLAYVAGAVLLFDAVTLVVFPPLGHLLGLSDRAFGVWAGLAMFSTGPVAAAGFAYSPVAGQYATLTKLVRNAFLGVVSVGYAVAYARRRGEAGSTGPVSLLRGVWAQFPKFLVGFVVVAVVANAGVLSSAALATVGDATTWLFSVAFAGVGLSVQAGEIRSAGVLPVLLLLVHLAVAGALTLAAVAVFL